MTDLDYIDHLILNTIHISGTMNDYELSQQLHCPRMLLLAHLERLINQDYVKNQLDNKYSLLEKGIREMVPLAYYEKLNVKDIFSEITFDWNYLYIPKEGWDNN